MSEIDQLRGRVGEITLEMIRLLKSRTDLALQIGRLKQDMGKGVTDRRREDELREDVRSLCRELGMSESLGARFLNFLLNESVSVQSTGISTHMDIFMRAKSLEAQGRHIVHMEVGEPDFAPPDVVRGSMTDAFDRGFTRYGPAGGMPQFRDALARYASKNFGADVSPSGVMVTPGGRFAVYLAISLLDPGDEIIVIDPAWPAYAQCAQSSGVKVTTIHTDMAGGWEPSAEQVKEAAGPGTRMLVLNYPNNPTGKVLSAHAQDEIVGAASDRGLYILSDEIYWQYAKPGWKSVLGSGYDKSIVVQSFSKSHAMTGFRVGYAMARPDVIGSMVARQAMLMACVAEPVQYAAMQALGADTDARSQTIMSRLDVISDVAKKMGLEFVRPDGAMYLFVRIGRDGTRLARDLLERGVAVAPGEAFGDYRDYIRISACQNEETLIKGMNIIYGNLGNRHG